MSINRLKQTLLVFILLILLNTCFSRNQKAKFKPEDLDDDILSVNFLPGDETGSQDSLSCDDCDDSSQLPSRRQIISTLTKTQKGHHFNNSKYPRLAIKYSIPKYTQNLFFGYKYTPMLSLNTIVFRRRQPSEKDSDFLYSPPVTKIPVVGATQAATHDLGQPGNQFTESNKMVDSFDAAPTNQEGSDYSTPNNGSVLARLFRKIGFAEMHHANGNKTEAELDSFYNDAMIAMINDDITDRERRNYQREARSDEIESMINDDDDDDDRDNIASSLEPESNETEALIVNLLSNKPDGAESMGLYKTILDMGRVESSAISKIIGSILRLTLDAVFHFNETHGQNTNESNKLYHDVVQLSKAKTPSEMAPLLNTIVPRLVLLFTHMMKDIAEKVAQKRLAKDLPKRMKFLHNVQMRLKGIKQDLLNVILQINVKSGIDDPNLEGYPWYSELVLDVQMNQSPHLDESLARFQVASDIVIARNSFIYIISRINYLYRAAQSFEEKKDVPNPLSSLRQAANTLDHIKGGLNIVQNNSAASSENLLDLVNKQLDDLNDDTDSKTSTLLAASAVKRVSDGYDVIVDLLYNEIKKRLTQENRMSRKKHRALRVLRPVDQVLDTMRLAAVELYDRFERELPLVYVRGDEYAWYRELKRPNINEDPLSRTSVETKISLTNQYVTEFINTVAEKIMTSYGDKHAHPRRRRGLQRRSETKTINVTEINQAVVSVLRQLSQNIDDHGTYLTNRSKSDLQAIESELTELGNITDRYLSAILIAKITLRLSNEMKSSSNKIAQRISEKLAREKDLDARLSKKGLLKMDLKFNIVLIDASITNLIVIYLYKMFKELNGFKSMINSELKQMKQNPISNVFDQPSGIEIQHDFRQYNYSNKAMAARTAVKYVNMLAREIDTLSSKLAVIVRKEINKKLADKKRQNGNGNSTSEIPIAPKPTTTSEIPTESSNRSSNNILNDGRTLVAVGKHSSVENKTSGQRPTLHSNSSTLLEKSTISPPDLKGNEHQSTYFNPFVNKSVTEIPRSQALKSTQDIDLAGWTPTTKPTLLSNYSNTTPTVNSTSITSRNPAEKLSSPTYNTEQTLNNSVRLNKLTSNPSTYVMPSSISSSSFNASTHTQSSLTSRTTSPMIIDSLTSAMVYHPASATTVASKMANTVHTTHSRERSELYNFKRISAIRKMKIRSVPKETEPAEDSMSDVKVFSKLSSERDESVVGMNSWFIDRDAEDTGIQSLQKSGSKYFKKGSETGTEISDISGKGEETTAALADRARKKENHGTGNSFGNESQEKQFHNKAPWDSSMELRRARDATKEEEPLQNCQPILLEQIGAIAYIYNALKVKTLDLSSLPDSHTHFRWDALASAHPGNNIEQGVEFSFIYPMQVDGVTFWHKRPTKKKRKMPLEETILDVTVYVETFGKTGAWSPVTNRITGKAQKFNTGEDRILPINDWLSHGVSKIRIYPQHWIIGSILRLPIPTFFTCNGYAQLERTGFGYDFVARTRFHRRSWPRLRRKSKLVV